MWYLIPLAIAYILINFLIWRNAVRLMGEIAERMGRSRSLVVVIIFTAVFAFLAFSIIIWTFFSIPSVVHSLKAVSNVWIGIFVYCLVFIVSGEIITFILWLLKKVRKDKPGYSRFIFIRGIIVAALIVGFSVYGMINWQNIRVTEYDISVDKHTELGSDLKIVLIADTHIGYTVGQEHIQNMVDLINEQDADLVAFAGDIVDNDYAAIENPDAIAKTFRSIKSKYGVFGCYGNHDVYEKLVGGFSLYSLPENTVQKEVDMFVENSGIELLEDEVVAVEDLYVIGRIDRTKPNGSKEGDDLEKARESIGELTADLDKSKVIIDIDHQPSELEEKADAGVDIDLCGHTHDGQIFPGNLTINLGWENACGLLDIKKMHSIVTSGAGVWGPAMRVGANPEITVVNVHFTK